MSPPRRPLLAGLLLAALAAGAGAEEAPKPSGDEGDVPYVPTPEAVVDRMLELAGVAAGDYVIDLGSGDGRIVIAAAERGAFGHGVEIDPERNADARRKARRAGVSERVAFLREDFFETDVRPASVVTLYLFEEVNEKLRPRLLEQLRPGTRIVSHAFDMGEWEPDATARVSTDTGSKPGMGPRATQASSEAEGERSLDLVGEVDVTGPLDWPPPRDPRFVLDVHDVYLWVVPADASGSWTWEVDGRRFRAEVEQRFQKVALELEAGAEGSPAQVKESALRGPRLQFRAEIDGRRYAYSGRIEGDAISGTVQIRRGEAEDGTLRSWSATRRR